MLISLQLPYSLSSSSLKPCSIAGKRIGERPSNDLAWPSSPVPKFRCSVSADAERGIDEGKPKHVAIIIDGHRKWGERRGLSVHHGHKRGVMNFKHVASQSSNLGIKILTIYLFSTENWNRSKMEVDFLMNAFEDFIREDVKELIARLGIRFSVIGNKSSLSESMQTAISCCEELSHGNKGMHLILALSYGGRNDIVEAAKKIATKVKDGSLEVEEVDESVFEQHLMTHVAECPNPDLLIRAGGELRLSNFFLWQLSYTEFYFTDTLFPDFGEPHLLQALASYRGRKRGYGERRA